MYPTQICQEITVSLLALEINAYVSSVLSISVMHCAWKLPRDFS